MKTDWFLDSCSEIFFFILEHFLDLSSLIPASTYVPPKSLDLLGDWDWLRIGFFGSLPLGRGWVHITLSWVWKGFSRSLDIVSIVEPIWSLKLFSDRLATLNRPSYNGEWRNISILRNKKNPIYSEPLEQRGFGLICSDDEFEVESTISSWF